MAIYDGDQQTTATVLINGVHVAMSAAPLKAIAPASSVYTFSAAYSHIVNGKQLSYKRGGSYILDPALLVVLQALGAPMVAA